MDWNRVLSTPKTYAGAILSPHQFFQTETSGRPSYDSLGVVVLAAVANATPPAAIMYLVSDVVTFDVQLVLLFGGFIGIFSGFFAVLALWFIISAILYLLAMYLEGTGTFRETALLAGWGFLPRIVTSLYSGLSVYVVGKQVLTAETIARTSIGAATHALREHPIADVTTVVTIIGLGWSGMFWTLGMKYGHDLNSYEAMLAASVPTVGSILFVAIRAF